MSVFLISYDVFRRDENDRDDRALIVAIQRYPSCQVMPSLWLMRTDRQAADILHELWAQMRPEDGLMVTEITGDVMAWLGLDRDVANWILRNNPAADEVSRFRPERA